VGAQEVRAGGMGLRGEIVDGPDRHETNAPSCSEELWKMGRNTLIASISTQARHAHDQGG
jgi:hypothetical protein